MSRNRILTLLGVLIFLSPFIGLPYSWLTVILPVLGVLVLIIAFTPSRTTRVKSNQATSPDSVTTTHEASERE